METLNLHPLFGYCVSVCSALSKAVMENDEANEMARKFVATTKMSKDDAFQWMANYAASRPETWRASIRHAIFCYQEFGRLPEIGKW